MAKTRSQAGNITIRKEEEEDYKDNLLLNGVPTATRNKITKRKPFKRNNRHLPVQQVKVEDDTDTKALLKSTSNHSKLSKRTYITQEQINQLIDYVENHNMSVTRASCMAKMSPRSGCTYYNLYKNDSDKKIPSPQNQFRYPQRCYTQEHIENLIKYIVHDKMSVPQASAKANMSYRSGIHHYHKYLKKSNYNIPIPRPCRYYTQDQKNEFIGYIVNDKMSISAASRKARMSYTAASAYYHKYFNDQNHDIATPSHIAIPKRYTQEQIKGVISYIINDKMTVYAASKKANMDHGTASKYYRQYLKNNNMELPVPKNNKPHTPDKINELIGYIVNDKMTITAASRKAKMGVSVGIKYYHEYFDGQNSAPSHINTFKHYTQEQIKEVISCIVDDKMTIAAASRKVNMPYDACYRYYRKYQKDHDLLMPSQRYTTQNKRVYSLH